MTKPVTEFVAYLPAQRRRQALGQPALGRYDPRRTGRTDSWRERQVVEGLRNHYNAPLATAAGRFIKTPGEVMRRAGGAEKARCEGGFAAR
jgi:hypothetical protein